MQNERRKEGFDAEDFSGEAIGFFEPDPIETDDFGRDEKPPKKEPWMVRAVAPWEVGILSDEDLIQAMIDYRDREEQIKQEQKSYEDVVKAIENQVIKRFVDRGQMSGTFIDKKTGRQKTISIKEDANPIPRFGKSDPEYDTMVHAFYQTLKDNGFDHIFNKPFGRVVQDFRSSLKEYYNSGIEDPNTGRTVKALPPEWDKFFRVEQVFKVGVRTK